MKLRQHYHKWSFNKSEKPDSRLDNQTNGEIYRMHRWCSFNRISQRDCTLYYAICLIFMRLPKTLLVIPINMGIISLVEVEREHNTITVQQDGNHFKPLDCCTIHLQLNGLSFQTFGLLYGACLTCPQLMNWCLGNDPFSCATSCNFFSLLNFLLFWPMSFFVRNDTQIYIYLLLSVLLFPSLLIIFHVLLIFVRFLMKLQRISGP